MHNPQPHTARIQLRDFLSGVLMGGLIGSAFMLLAAPQSGKRTQAHIRRRSLELRDQATEVIDEARKNTAEAVRQARLKVRQLKRGAGATVKDWQSRGHALLEEQKDRVESALESLQLTAKDGRR